jgi:hypothetical protein
MTNFATPTIDACAVAPPEGPSLENKWCIPKKKMRRSFQKQKKMFLNMKT